MPIQEAVGAAVRAHLSAIRAEGMTNSTQDGRRHLLKSFVVFARSRGLSTMAALTTEEVHSYQLHVDQLRRCATISLGTVRNRLLALRQFLRWGFRTARLSVDLAQSIRLPRPAIRLPRDVLTLREAEQVLEGPAIASPLGLRDRAMLEVLFSSGLRRAELIGLDVADIDLDGSRVFIREGKGRRDRVVPLSARARGWILRYLDAARPRLLQDAMSSALFINERHRRVSRTQVNHRFRGYLVASGVHKVGSCHIWRHTMATLMHDGGADIRDLQQMLGHADISTTAIYTRVSATRLAEVHRRTHPASV
jgi:integrase/recombinase XerD